MHVFLKSWSYISKVWNESLFCYVFDLIKVEKYWNLFLFKKYILFFSQIIYYNVQFYFKICKLLILQVLQKLELQFFLSLWAKLWVPMEVLSIMKTGILLLKMLSKMSQLFLEMNANLVPHIPQWLTSDFFFLLISCFYTSLLKKIPIQ